MAISSVGGNKNSSASAVLSLTVTYSPTSGNAAIIFVERA